MNAQQQKHYKNISKNIQSRAKRLLRALSASYTFVPPLVSNLSNKILLRYCDLYLISYPSHDLIIKLNKKHWLLRWSSRSKDERTPEELLFERNEVLPVILYLSQGVFKYQHSELLKSCHSSSIFYNKIYYCQTEDCINLKRSGLSR